VPTIFLVLKGAMNFKRLKNIALGRPGGLAEGGGSKKCHGGTLIAFLNSELKIFGSKR